MSHFYFATFSAHLMIFNSNTLNDPIMKLFRLFMLYPYQAEFSAQHKILSMINTENISVRKKA